MWSVCQWHPVVLSSGCLCTQTDSLYRQKVTTPAQALEQPETRTETTEALRGPITRAQNRTEGELGSDAEARHKCEEVGRKPAISRCTLKWWRGRATSGTCNFGPAPQDHPPAFTRKFAIPFPRG